MITFPKNKLGVCAGEAGRHSLRVAKPGKGGAISSADFEMFREKVLSAPQ